MLIKTFVARIQVQEGNAGKRSISRTQTVLFRIFLYVEIQQVNLHTYYLLQQVSNKKIRCSVTSRFKIPFSS